jgi:hypothetical protein
MTEGSGRGLFLGTIPAFVRRDFGMLRETSIKQSVSRPEFELRISRIYE